MKDSKNIIENHENNIRILIVIPTYNNRKTLRGVVEKSLEVGEEVLVVNDGSTDGAMETLQNLPISQIDFPKNQGKGKAILAAAKWGQEHNFTHLITIDADGQHLPRESLRFIEEIKSNPLSIIVGCRDFSSLDVPTSSRFGRHFSNFWLKMSAGISLGDSQSGFRAYPIEVLNSIKCYGSRYNFEVEILVRAAWAGLSISSVPISVEYTQQTKQASHFRPLWDNLDISKTYARLVTRNFIPWPHKILYGSRQEEKIKFFFLNPIHSIKMLFKERTSAKEITIACMLGIFLGTLPLIACHGIVIIFCATRLRLNRLIALNISHLCAPPFVPALAIEIGYFFRNGHFLVEFNKQTLGYEALHRFVDYLIGTIILAPILAIIVGILVYSILMISRKKHLLAKGEKEKQIL